VALRLNFGSAEDKRSFVNSGCLVPSPPVVPASRSGGDVGGGREGDSDKDDDDKKKNKKRSSKRKNNRNALLRFECSPMDGSHPSIEAVAILSTHVDTSDPKDCAILFEVELSVRSSADSDDNDNNEDHDGEENESNGGVVENGHGTSSTMVLNRGANSVNSGRVGGEGVIQIRAVLSERVPTGTATGRSATRQTGKHPAKVPLGLLALELGGGCAVPTSRPIGTTALASSSASAPSTVHYSTLQTRTAPVQLRLTLVEPLIITVREVGAARAASGATLVSVVVSHSNLHDEVITVTNLAIHPGHSRPWDPSMVAAETEAVVRQQQGRVSPSKSQSPTSRDGGGAGRAGQVLLADDGYSSPSGSHVHNTSILAGPNAVLDMSTSVRWGYAPGTAPSLPLVLKPRESVATVLQIDAGENLKTRGYISPVAVTAVVGGRKGDEKESGVDGSANSAGRGDSDRLVALAVPPLVPVTVTTDARWTTARLAVEPADAFRVDLSLAGSGSTCKVGAPVVVGLRVMNLSSETKDLMLLMAKDEESSRDKGGGLGFGGFNRRYRERNGVGSNASVSGGASVVTSGSTPLIGGRPFSPSAHGVNTAVVSEVNGYTFGVWGLSGDDDGTARHNRDHELLAVDAALLLGEVKGQHTIEAELRFVPLREGTLDVPNLKLYDKMGGRWYNCVHLLQIVANAATEA